MGGESLAVILLDSFFILCTHAHVNFPRVDQNEYVRHSLYPVFLTLFFFCIFWNKARLATIRKGGARRSTSKRASGDAFLWLDFF